MYKRQMTRLRPGCFLFLIDQSASMHDPYAGSQAPGEKIALPGQELAGSKAERLAIVLNGVLESIVLRSTKETGVQDHSHIMVLGYTTDPNGKPKMSSALGPWAGETPVTLSQLAANPSRVEREKLEANPFGELIRRRVMRHAWVEPIAKFGTPMCAALIRAREVLEPWIAAYPRSFPPIVVHITDGESTDGDPRSAAGNLRALATEDGPVLLFNAHLSSDDSPPTLFPDAIDRLDSNEFAQTLFEMSSTLPSTMAAYAREQDMGVTAQSRGFAFNADFNSLERLLDIGTRTDLR